MDLGRDGLLTLTAVLDAGTFEAAADLLHVTPSAVSQRIKAMETAVGRVLVRRTKPITATRDGEVLLRLARQWELLAAEADVELTGAAPTADTGTALADLPRVTLPIAVNADSLATWLMPPLARFHREHPVAVEVLRDDEALNAQLLKTGDVMGAITSDPVPVRGTTVRALGAMRYLPVATPEFLHTWMPEGPTAAALARAPMVVFDRNDRVQQSVLERLTSPTPTPPTVYIPASAEYHRAVEAGIGWGAVPLAQAGDALAAGEVIRFTEMTVDVPLYWQYWTLGSALLSALTDLIVEATDRALVHLP